jgi:predicted O-methyltransferase YrrM
MTAAQLDRPMLPPGDYVSPNLQTVRLDDAFPDMIVGDISLSDWSYPRGGIVHNWYVDRRNPTVGFLNRDEASILYNTALMFADLPCLEIGCWRGWSTAHFALGSGGLEVIDPVLRDPVFREDVMISLQRAGVLDHVMLHDGTSPDELERISASTGKRWSMVFIDGNHEGDAPRLDAEAAQRYAADDALILFHDMGSPYVATGFEYLRAQGWETAIYRTTQIMGVAVRGAARPVAHTPDPSQPWTLPAHLASFPLVGESRGARLFRATSLSLLTGSPLPDGTRPDLRALDALPENETAAVDPLLLRAGAIAGDVPTNGGKSARAFDELQRRHLRPLDKLQKLEHHRTWADDFERLRLKQFELIQKLGVAECIRDRFQCQLTPWGYAAIRRFSYWMARKRTLFGLSRRVLLGRTTQVRSIIEETMDAHDVPRSVVDATIDLLSRPRVVLGLARRRSLAGLDAVQGLVLLILQCAHLLQRLQALEASKLDDEKALLEAQLVIAKLRGPVVAQTT